MNIEESSIQANVLVRNTNYNSYGKSAINMSFSELIEHESIDWSTLSKITQTYHHTIFSDSEIAKLSDKYSNLLEFFEIEKISVSKNHTVYNSDNELFVILRTNVKCHSTGKIGMLVRKYIGEKANDNFYGFEYDVRFMYEDNLRYASLSEIAESHEITWSIKSDFLVH